MSTGIIDHQLAASLSKSDQFFDNTFQLEDNEFRSLIFDDYKGIITLIIMGLAFDCIALIGELIFSNLLFK